jgi:uncharacterized protein YbcI
MVTVNGLLEPAVSNVSKGDRLSAVPSEDGHLRGGRLNAALANAMVGLHTRYVGRGPTRAQVFFRRNIVVVVMDGAMTKGELSLIGAGDFEVVARLRRQFFRAMRADLVEAVEALTGCAVAACMGDALVADDVIAHLFILDRPVAEEPLAAPAD